jgi:5'-3' exoribonuclease 2
VAKEYIGVMLWTGKYYLNSCPSWSWYYLWEHGPFIKDIYNVIKELDINDIIFDYGKPSKPFLQLLLVLPPQSVKLLPEKFHKIMLSNNSSIIYMYPNNFTFDYIGKNKYWQIIPLLPALEIKSTKRIYKKYKIKLDKQELTLNKSIEPFEFY